MNDSTEPVAGGGNDRPSSGELLREVEVLRDRTSAAARGYWLPLLLFGALICGSIAFYRRLTPPPVGTRLAVPPASCTAGLNHPCHTGPIYHITVITALGYYWQIAIPLGVVLTVLWYRWRGNRVGLRTPALGFLITGLVLSELVLLVPLLVAPSGAGLWHDTHQAGPLVIIAALLWVLAWAERSRALALISGLYLVAALVVTQFTNGGLSGANTGAADVSLIALRLLGLIPAVILLAAGGEAWLLRRVRLRRTGLAYDH